MPDPIDSDRHILDCRGRALDLTPFRADGAAVMGVLNVTPDSFSDGGRFLEVEDAVRRTGEMLDAGASVIDVGGESSRPAGSVYGEGAPQVGAEEEKGRVIPVVEAIRDRYPEAILSVDTYKAEVAREVLEAGAHIINDITGLRHDPELAEIVAEHEAGLILMHSVGEPGELTHQTGYEDLVGEVKASLKRSLERAREAGLEDLVVDPGFGFGKSTRGNLRLLAATPEFRELGRPVMVGVSRKSSIGAVLGALRAERTGSDPSEPVPTDERLYGSLGATAVAVVRGASLVRAHDVKETVETLRLIGATLASYEPTPVRS